MKEQNYQILNDLNFHSVLISNDNLKNISFSKQGLQYSIQGVTFVINWLEIAEIIAYKVDLMTYDEVRLDIKCSGQILTIDEESENWDKLCSRLSLLFPMIDIKWLGKVIQQPFKANRTILYQNSHPRVFADFLNSDGDGRIRLNNNGSISDLGNLPNAIQENTWLLLTDYQELAVYGLTKFSVEENLWVAEIEWEGFMEI